MNKNFLLALPLAATLILPAAAQTSTNNNSDQSQQSGQIQTGISNQPSTDAKAGSASNDNLGPHQPLQPDTHEGFWGHLNPFARKKYIQRQVSPIRDRVNELDELTASNTKMLKDVDSRATQGIQMASNRAGEADQKATVAGQHAQEANQTAQQASTRLQSVEQVVGNIDDYKSAGSAELKFRAGQSTLSKSSKEEIDQMVANLANQRGYVIQVQGFSPGRGQEAIQSSQTMAQAVARYLVIEHQIPVYRIFVVGMGNAPVQSSAEGQAKKVRGGRVEVSVLKNGLDQLQQSASSSASSQGGVAGAASTSSSPSNNNATPSSAAGNAGAQSNDQSAPWQKSTAPAQANPPAPKQPDQSEQPK
jgi:outer membrane protein OmpA-like peptidoglycan-associated protein